MSDSQIKLGSMLFSVMEPHRGYEVEYNRWYERDHFYAGVMVGQHTFAGRRFVATRREKALRYPADSPVSSDRTRGSYLAVYWVESEYHDAWSRWAGEQVQWLRSEDRMFPHRDHVYTVIAGHDWAAYRSADGVPAALALDHPFQGLVAIVGAPAAGVSREQLDAWYREEHLPQALADSPAAMCLSFSPQPMRTDSSIPQTSPDQFVHLYFLDGGPKDAWASHFAGHGEALAKSGLGRVQWASPFIPTLPGTDTYADELW